MEKPSKTDPTASLACFLHMLAQQCVAAFRSFFPVFLNHQSRKREQSEIRSHLNQKPCPCSASHYLRVTRQNNQVQQTSVNASPADTRAHPAGEAAKASSTERYDARARAKKESTWRRDAQRHAWASKKKATRMAGGLFSLRQKNRRLPESIYRNHVWRTEGDSNPRYAINVYTLSRRAPSTTRPPVLMDFPARLGLLLQMQKMGIRDSSRFF